MDTFILHGIVPREAAAPPDTPPHLTLVCDELAALISTTSCDVAGGDADVVAAIAMRHHAILMSYADIGPVLPMRFGSAFSTTEAIRMRISETFQSSRDALAALAGMHEFSLGIVPCAAAPGEPRMIASGREFLAKGLAARQFRETRSARQHDLVRHLVEGVRPIAHCTSLLAARSDRIFGITVVIHDRDMGRFRALRDELARRAEDSGVALQCIGPWPCYSFQPGTEDRASVA